MSEPTLKEKLDYLESQMAAIKAEIEERDKPKVDESYIGHVVEVRDHDDDEWVVGVLTAILGAEADSPYRLSSCGWKQCRPRQAGPSVGRWIKHDGSEESPVDSQELVVAESNGGRFYSVWACARDWRNVKRYAIIKIG